MANAHHEKDLSPPRGILRRQQPGHGNMLMTHKRRLILDILDEANDHPTAEQIHMRAVRRDHRISLATVYRNLVVLVQAGLLIRHEFGEGRGRYEKRRAEQHYHLLELGSGKVVEFREPAIRELICTAAQTLGYDLVDHRLDILGSSSIGKV